MDYDQFLVHLGSFGRWQKFIFGLVGLVALGNAFITMSQSFVLYTPDFRYYISYTYGT